MTPNNPRGKFNAMVETLFKMVNATASSNYHTYALRELDSKTRMTYIEKTLERVSEKFKIGLVCIDGIADLMHDTNSLTETNEVMTRIMQWTTIYKLHLMTVVHLNFGDNPKPTGHIGSAITKKAETVAILIQIKGRGLEPSPYHLNTPGTFHLKKWLFRWWTESQWNTPLIHFKCLYLKT